MKYLKRLNVVVLGTFLMACGGDSDASVLVHGITAGNNQAVTAGAPELDAPVAWRLARSRDGRITLRRLITPLLPELAYAQGGTVVTGSPVPGAVVCVQEVAALVPFARCTNTDANGQATFFFEVGTTVAGNYKAEIRGTLEGQPAVFDTVSAAVLVGPPDPNATFDLVGERISPAVYIPAHVTDSYANPIPYRLVSDGRVTAQDTVLGSLGARTLTFAASSVDSVWRTTTVTGALGAAVVRFTYRLAFRADGVPKIQAVYCGLNVSPCVSTLWK